MSKLINVLISIVLMVLSLAFIAFAMQNNSDVTIVVPPEYNFNIKVYTLVLACFALGFISSLFVTRFEYIKAKINLLKIINKLKKFKNKSKYIED